MAIFNSYVKLPEGILSLFTEHPHTLHQPAEKIHQIHLGSQR